jgi:hypothetical protein
MLTCPFYYGSNWSTTWFCEYVWQFIKVESVIVLYCKVHDIFTIRYMKYVQQWGNDSGMFDMDSDK